MQLVLLLFILALITTIVLTIVALVTSFSAVVGLVIYTIYVLYTMDSNRLMYIVNIVLSSVITIIYLMIVYSTFKEGEYFICAVETGYFGLMMLIMNSFRTEDNV